MNESRCRRVREVSPLRRGSSAKGHALVAVVGLLVACGEAASSLVAPGDEGGGELTASEPDATSEASGTTEAPNGAPGATGAPDATPATAPAPSESMVPPAPATTSTGGNSPPAEPAPSGGGAPAPGPSSSAPAQTSPPTPPVSTGSSPPEPAPAPAAPPPVTGPLGNETTCNGTDDDGNGVIDDVDVAGDGVCDCLSIAVVGLHGEWGSGNALSGWIGERIERQAEVLEPEQINAEGLQPFQLLVVRDVSTNNTPGLSFSGAQVSDLWQWVREGGGLMTLIGYSDATEIDNVNRLLEPFGLSYGAEQIIQGEGQAAPVTEWFEHPVSEGVTQLGADNGYPVLGQGVTIAAEQGYEVGKAVTIGDGHVLVWGDEWITYEAEWVDAEAYQVARFWQNALRWLTRANECQVPPAP